MLSLFIYEAKYKNMILVRLTIYF